MGLGFAAIAVSILCLVASLAFGTPAWVNMAGVVTGLVGLILIGRAKKRTGV